MNVKAFLGKYLVHITGGLLASAVFVSGLNPALIPAKYLFIAAVAKLIVTAAHAGRLSNIGDVVSAVANAATQAIAKGGTALALMLALPLLLSLHGCASVQAFLSSPTGTVVVQAGVDAAVATAETKGVSAAQLNALAKQVLADDQGATVTVAALTTELNAELVKLKVPAGDMAAITILETAFDAYVSAKYDNSATVQNLQADVATFCNQVISATGG